MDIENARPADNGAPYSGGHSIETVKGICGIPARLTGFFSWSVQLFILILSAVLTALIFVHIGGYSYFIKVHNSTSLIDFITSESNDTNFITETTVSSIINDFETSQVVHLLNGNDTHKQEKIFHGPFEQIESVHLAFGQTFVIDLFPCLRTLNVFYIIFCIFWLISLGGLLLSLKLELLDLFCPNIFLLMIAIITLFVQAISIGILLFFQKEYNWPILLIISGTVGGLFVCFALAIFAFVLLVVWYKYIDYMNNRKDACVCISSIIDLIKRRNSNTRNQATAAAEYTVPEATNHSHLPYIDEPPVQQFSSF